MLRTALLSSILILSPSSLRAQAVGSQLRPFVLEKLTQTGARSLEDFYGRALLLEFFAFWCRPCAQSVPHLNELQARFGPRGLSVVGVTAEEEEKTLPWMRKLGVEYACAFDPEAQLLKWFRVSGIPFAVLIDPQGTIVWSGPPSGLTGATIEKALAGALATPLWEWPAEVRALREALARGDHAAALREAAAVHVPISGAEPAELVRARIAASTAAFEGAVQRGEYYAAFELGARLEKELAGLPEGERLVARLGELRADPEVVRQHGGQERLARIEMEAPSVPNLKRWTELRGELEALAREFHGTGVERQASARIAELDRLLQRRKAR